MDGLQFKGKELDDHHETENYRAAVWLIFCPFYFLRVFLKREAMGMEGK